MLGSLQHTLSFHHVLLILTTSTCTVCWSLFTQRCIIIPPLVYHYTALQNCLACSTDSDNGFPTFRDIPYILYCIVIVTLSTYNIIIIQLLNAYQSNDTGNESARSGQVILWASTAIRGISVVTQDIQLHAAVKRLALDNPVQSFTLSSHFLFCRPHLA